MRIVAGIASIFLVGLGAGWWLTRAEASAGPEGAALPVRSESAEMVKLRAEFRRIDDERGFFAERNAALEQEAEALRKDQSELEEALREAVAFVDEPPAPAEAAAPKATPEPRQRGDRSRPAPTPEQMVEFRRSFEEGMQTRLDGALAELNDPGAAQRVEDLMAWRDRQMELAQQLRNAKTDDEREKIAAEMQEARRNARSLLNEQQDSILSALAAASGITDPKAQAKLMADLKATMDNPFFRMETMLLGGPAGRGGPRGFGNGRPPRAPTN